MKDLYFLSWFLKDDRFHASLKAFHKSGRPCFFLTSQLSQYKERIEKEKVLLVKNKFSTVLFCDPDYPDCFKDLERPPWVLTYFGNLNLLKQPRLLSIVGSRRLDPEAEYWLNDKILELDKKTVVVSGGAIGADQVAHKAALLNNLSTVVVLPVGLGALYPKSLIPLIRKLLLRDRKKALFLSQFPPSQKVYKSSFYPRNYILASISSDLVVLQAEIKSGSMVTARYALEQGKEISTLPASPWDKRYSGNLKLLEEGAFQLIDFSLIQK